MAEQNAKTGGTAPGRRDEKLEKLRPTLFIGVGGTGTEILLRIRRHILNALWGSAPNRVRVESLAEFPVAQFINFDLDAGTVVESGQSQKLDLLHDLVKFADQEKIVESFDIEKYSRDDDSLGRFPHIQSWSPLTPKKIRELGIDPSKGAGQIRGISRLYFYDKYPKVRDQIRLKLRSLKSGLSKDAQLKRLGLELEQDKFRIVVACSLAGGTGAGSFLDMGWLAGSIARDEVSSAEVELVALMPSGFQGAGKDRTEANGYAALMELETAMRGGAVGRYITRWDAYDKPTLATRPFDEVYLVDSGNVAQQHTSDIKDVYQMVADALFENFASADFANKKRSIAVNQRQHKIVPLSPPVTVGRYGDMKLSYYKGYSAFGQAVLDTQQEFRRDLRAHAWAGEMLKAFFGVAGGESQVNRATDKQRDQFCADHMMLAPASFSDFPMFSSRNVDLRRSSGEFVDYRVVDELLKDKQGSLLAGVQQKVDDRLEAIKAGFKRDEWGAQIREVVKQLERDSIRDQDSTADTTEDRVARQRGVLFAQTRERIRDQLYIYLDNKQFGGLEYVLSLVEQIKDRLANSSTGLIAALGLNAARYQEIEDAVRTHEYERLMGNLDQTRGGFFGGGEKQAVVVMDQLKTEIANFVKFHLRAKAAHEAAGLMADLSQWLGDRSGVDASGRPTWTGLVGELQAGRESVLQMLASLQLSVDNLRQDLKRNHATYIIVEAPAREVPLPSAETLREWADESFKDIGGSRVLFPMLAEPGERAVLLGKVKRMAERKIALGAADAGAEEEQDPLVAALEQMSPTERQRRFSELLSRAMPWIDANLSRDYTPVADQYKCFIGVANASDFERRFRAEIIASLPTGVITGNQLGIVETGVSGRAVCFCELSGIPLTVLRGLESWRTSYRKESEKIPVHTHIDSTQFAHPLVTSMDELNALADDFKTYLLAVMLGVLTRSVQRTPPAGQYQLLVRRGESLKMGNERAFRQNGLPVAYRDQIVAQVNDRLDALGATGMGLIATLAGFYENRVYAARLVPDETGLEVPRKGFASAMAGEAARELKARALRKGLKETEFVALETRALDSLSVWAGVVEGSENDAYEWEVREADADEGPRAKYILRKDFAEEWTKAEQRASGSGAIDAPLLRDGAQLPPALPAIPAYQYMVGVNNQPAGPYTADRLQELLAAGRLQPSSLVWRQGFATWLPLGQVPELAALLLTPPPLPMEPLPPPSSVQ